MVSFSEVLKILVTLVPAFRLTIYFTFTTLPYPYRLHAGITLYTIASGILVFAEDDAASWAHWYAMALLPISLCFCMYALHVFLWRADRIKTRIPGRWDDPRGPYLLGGLLVAVLSLNLATKMLQLWNYNALEEL